jgi:excinuclease ABC subunit C
MIDRRKLDHLPDSPGVYLLKDDAGEFVYIGKANSVRSRVRSYFRQESGQELRHYELARIATDVESIVAGSAAEALVLEANLIKEHQPRFNIQLKDDKRYPFVKVTVQEPFPRVFVTRQLRRDGGRYFGPFTSVAALRHALDVVKRVYTVRSCRYDLPEEAPPRPCLDYHIGRCKAPCVGLQSEADYRAMISEIVRILEGDTEALRREAQARMEDASRHLRFEDAAHERDVLRGLASIAREQRMESAKGWSRDVLGVARDGALAAAVVLRIRKGKLIGRESHRFTGLGDETDEDLLGAFTSLYYLGRGTNVEGELPREILLPTAIPDQKVLEEVLSERGGRRVRFRVPERGEKRRMTDLAAANARHLLEERVTALEVASDRADSVLYELQDRLELMVVPRLIACFDISHTQGSELVASVVTFENGAPKRSQYRHMRIRGEWTNDDYRSMAEVVERYVGRKLREGEPLPELLLLDGGKGQLSAVQPVLAALGAGEIALAALAKRNEEIYLPGRDEPVRLSRRDPALRLLQRIRNEAHRVAVSYNRKLRGRRTLRSELSEIPGIGPERQRALLSHFGSVRRIREATPEEIAEAPGFSKALGERVINHLRAAG